MQSQEGKHCGCKGIRSCLLCEETSQVNAAAVSKDVCHAGVVYSYCQQCGSARQESIYSPHPHEHNDIKSFDFPGIVIVKDFVSKAEEQQLCSDIDKTPFVKSQSGRCKQDYGPKVNFKKQKVKPEVFTGLPCFSKFVYDRMKKVSILQDFIPVELCNLEYTPDRGSAIDPHFDDFWLWGGETCDLELGVRHNTVFHPWFPPRSGGSCPAEAEITPRSLWTSKARVEAWDT